MLRCLWIARDGDENDNNDGDGDESDGGNYDDNNGDDWNNDDANDDDDNADDTNDEYCDIGGDYNDANHNGVAMKSIGRSTLGSG